MLIRRSNPRSGWFMSFLFPPKKGKCEQIFDKATCSILLLSITPFLLEFKKKSYDLRCWLRQTVLNTNHSWWQSPMKSCPLSSSPAYKVIQIQIDRKKIDKKGTNWSELLVHHIFITCVAVLTKVMDGIQIWFFSVSSNVLESASGRRLYSWSKHLI